MPKKRPARRQRMTPNRRIDVTRLEFLHLVDLVERNGETIKRLEKAADVQFTRTAQLQAALDQLTKAQTEPLVVAAPPGPRGRVDGPSTKNSWSLRSLRALRSTS